MERDMPGTRYVIGHISSAAKTFLKQHKDEETKSRVSEALGIICASPLHYQRRIKEIKGKPGDEFRYRFGGVRLHYAVNRQAKSIDILNIDDRGDIRY